MFIVGFGDSITAGAYLNKEETYLYKLGQRLDCEVSNAGVPGNTSAQGIARMQEDVIEKKPNICIVAFGMNDHVALSRNQSKVPLDDFTHNLNHICKEIRLIGGTPVLCTIHPIIEGDDSGYYYSRHPREWYAEPDGVSAWINRYNEAIRHIAVHNEIMLADIDQWWRKALEHGAKLTDLLRTTENSGVSDGVHPTELGQELYAECIAEVIEREMIKA